MLAPVITGVVLGALVPTGLVSMFYGLERHEQRKANQDGRKRWLTYEPIRKLMDDHGNIRRFPDEFTDFKPILGHYMKCAEVLITLSSASLIFIPSLHLNAKIPWLALPLVLLGCTVVDALAFMGLLVFFYEQSLDDPSNLTAMRHAINYGLGFSALSLFALAYFLVAVFVGLAVSDGATLVFHA